VSASLRAIRVVLANPGLRRLQLAWAGSMLGTCAYLIALLVVAFQAGGATAVGLVMMARMAAAAIASPVLAVLADMYPRRRVMVWCDAVRTGLTAILAALVWQHAAALWIYTFAVLIAVASTAFRPAQAALVPSLAATPEELTASNAVATTIESAGIFAGPGIGGLVLAVSGTGSVFALCVAAYAWSAVLVWSIPEPERTTVGEEGDGAAGRELTAGLKAIASAPSLLAVTATYAAQALVAGCLAVFSVVLAIDVLGLGPPGVGYLDSAFGVGGVLGGVIATGMAGAQRLATAFAVGVLAWGAGVALLGATTSSVVVVALMAGIGLGNTIVDVAAVTLVQRSAPDHVLGRVFGVLESVLLAAVGLGSLVAPAMIGAIGIRPALAVTGLALPAIVAVAARTLVRLDRVEPETARRIGLLRAHRIFAPLADATLEQLARRLEPVRFAAGSTVIRQGDRGDTVYLVAGGQLAVDVDGKPGKPLEAGDVFGEIALLRDVPRTASVRAVTECELLTLGRDEFLAAVTGHPRSAAEADVVISARLGALRPGVLTA
jgi:MFS family permease